MILNAALESVLQYIILRDELNPGKMISTDDICKHFSDLSADTVCEMCQYLSNHDYVMGIFADNGEGDCRLLLKGKTYFQDKMIELESRKPNITINNSSGFNVGNNNTVNISHGLTADETIRIIEHSSLNDKEALREIIVLLNDALQNNKPIEPKKFDTILNRVSSVSTIIQFIGQLVFAKMNGQF